MIEISGPWTVESPARPGEVFAAAVPGVVHEDLVRAGVLANPYASTADAFAAHWVSREDWTYRTTFSMPDRVPEGVRGWQIQLDGVDTFAEVRVNGTVIGTTDNALRSWRLTVPDDLLSPVNDLAVLVHGHERMVADRVPEARARLHHEGGIEGLLGKSLIRRYQRSFFAESSLLNLGTGVLGLGINRKVWLRPIPEVCVEHVFFDTLGVDETGAHVEVHVGIEADAGAGADLVARLTLVDEEGAVAARAGGPVGATGGVLRLEVPEPRLWWPRGHGAPTLYAARVEILRGDDVVATAHRSVGLRTVRLVTDAATGRPGFELHVNGVSVYVRGTNYVPVDYLKVHGDDAAYRRVFALLENGNNNLVRMWGGGAPESEEFYAECDRRGILLWQDCYLHSNTYPDYDQAWVAGFVEECRQIVLRVREHASLVLLCGGNEQREGWDEWQWRDTLERFFGESLVVDAIPAMLESVPTGVPYIDNSPHGGLFSQSPVVGESHTWGNFFNATKDPVFVTETCWGQDSYSRPETLREVMDLDVDAFTGPTWTAKWKERTSLKEIHRFPYTGYHNVGGLRAYLDGLEVEQAMADYHALSHFRLRSPSNRGIVYWSFNKGGPLFQFGAVDYGLRPLMSHYVVARLYRDVAIGIYRDLEDVLVVASNATASAVAGVLEVVHVDGSGTAKGSWRQEVTVPAGAPVRLSRLANAYRAVADRTTEAVSARLLVDDVVVSEDRLLFCPLAEYVPAVPAVEVATRRVGDGAWEMTLRARGGVAKLVRLEDDERLLYSDNYFPLVPGFDQAVRVARLEGAGPARLSMGVLDDDRRTVIELA